MDEIKKALEAVNAGKFKMGPQVERAHEICQAHEGQMVFDWLHALVHRIEGDEVNADYWYRRAGRTRSSGSLRDEWQAITDHVNA